MADEVDADGPRRTRGRGRRWLDRLGVLILTALAAVASLALVIGRILGML